MTDPHPDLDPSASASASASASEVDATRVIAHLQHRIGQLATDLAVRDVLIEDLRTKDAPPSPS